jgi:hypothetical protein
MRPPTIQDNTEFARLHAVYEVAWRHFSAAVSQWQALESELPAEPLNSREAETAVHLAQQQYRQARNALAEYTLDHANHGSSRESANDADAPRQTVEELARPSGSALDSASVLREFLKSEYAL